jgi:large subunit ribosomal protein L18
MTLSREQKRRVRQARVRRTVRGSTERPRLCVFKSVAHFYVQVIDDSQGKTLVAASTLDKGLKSELKSTKDKAAAKAVGKLIAEKSKAAGIAKVVFDRNGFLYHGRIKDLADAARAAGLEF